MYSLYSFFLSTWNTTSTAIWLLQSTSFFINDSNFARHLLNDYHHMLLRVTNLNNLQETIISFTEKRSNFNWQLLLRNIKYCHRNQFPKNSLNIWFDVMNWWRFIKAISGRVSPQFCKYISLRLNQNCYILLIQFIH